jgi:hypothetical protein
VAKLLMLLISLGIFKRHMNVKKRRDKHQQKKNEWLLSLIYHCLTKEFFTDIANIFKAK